MDPISFLVGFAVGNTTGFWVGKYFEKATRERALLNFKKQVVGLSNRSAIIEDRYKKLLYSCAFYEYALQNVAKSDKENIRELKDEFEPLSKLLRGFSAKLTSSRFTNYYCSNFFSGSQVL